MRLGIGVMAFDRVDYLRECLRALKQNDLTDCDIYLFQDGVRCHLTGTMRGNAAKINESMQMFRRFFPEGKVVYQNNNVGIALNRLRMLETLLDRYEGFVALEDDAVISPNFVAIARHLTDQFANDTDIGLIRSPLMPQTAPPNEINLNSAHVGAMFTRRNWFQPLLGKYIAYCRMISAYPYTDQREWHRAVMMVFEKPITSSDAALEHAASEVHKHCWALGQPRARNIGKQGQHFRPEIFKRFRMGEVELKVYPDELTQPWAKVYS